MQENQKHVKPRHLHSLPSVGLPTGRPSTLTASDKLSQEYVALIQRAVNTHEHNVLRLPAVVKKTGRAASTIWRDIKLGTFVPPIHIGDRSVGWLQHEIDAVLEARSYASRSGTTVDIKTFVAALTAARTIPEPLSHIALEANGLTSTTLVRSGDGGSATSEPRQKR